MKLEFYLNSPAGLGLEKLGKMKPLNGEVKAAYHINTNMMLDGSHRMHDQVNQVLLLEVQNRLPWSRTIHLCLEVALLGLVNASLQL